VLLFLLIDPLLDPAFKQGHRHAAAGQHYVMKGLQIEFRTELLFGVLAISRT